MRVLLYLGCCMCAYVSVEHAPLGCVRYAAEGNLFSAHRLCCFCQYFCLRLCSLFVASDFFFLFLLLRVLV